MTVTAEEAYTRNDGIVVIPRLLFAREYWNYEAGQHVVFGGPSGKGKTELSFDLLAVTATPDFPAYVAVSKPTDPVTAKRSKELEFRRVEDWPVPSKISEMWNGRPAGYVIWPEFGDINADMHRAAGVTARLMADRYTASARGSKRSAGILVMDDTMVKAKIMGLDRQMVTILAMAKAMKVGLWVFVQKPTDSGRTTLWAYENGDHFFLGKGGDDRMLKRYQEIAGEKGPIVRAVVPTLKPFQFLYFEKDHGYICIVDAK
jgi:hypothetical protein